MADLVIGIAEGDPRVRSLWTASLEANIPALSRALSPEDPVPLSQGLVAIVADARSLARKMNCSRTGTDHLLLGALAAADETVEALLEALEIDSDHLRARILSASVLGVVREVLAPPLGPTAATALELSSFEAAAQLHEAAKAADMLRAVAACCDGLAGHVLRDCGVEPRRAQAA